MSRFWPNGFRCRSICSCSRAPDLFRAQKLRLGSRLLELSAADLRLTQEELAQYAGLCGLPLPERESQALLSVSEGWIAMVYLIFRAYAQTGTWRFDTKGMDTLIEQVMFEPLPERQRLFLLDNCMAEDFSAAQAAFVWQAPDADVLLHDLTHNNAFITESTPGRLPISPYAAAASAPEIRSSAAKRADGAL